MKNKILIVYRLLLCVCTWCGFATCGCATLVANSQSDPAVRYVMGEADDETDDETPSSASREKKETRIYEVGDFDALQCSGVVDVVYVLAPQCRVEVTTRQELFDKLSVRVTGGKLAIKLTGTFTPLRRGEKVRAVVAGPRLQSVELSGVCSFKGDTLAAPEVRLSVSGAGSLTLGRAVCDVFSCSSAGACHVEGKVTATRSFRLKNSGAGTLQMEANAGHIQVENSGASNMELTLKGDEILLKNAGAGNVNAEVECKSLHATNAGAAKVKLWGVADQVEVKNQGAGSLDTRRLNHF